MKRCSTCNQTKPLSEFTKNARRADGLHYTCRTCVSEQKRRYYYRDHEANKAKMRGRWQGEFAERHNLAKRLKNHGLTVGDLEEMRERQMGLCAICCDPMTPGRDAASSEHIDHDHETGEVRSLLCGNCNTMIGRAREHPDILIAGAAYLISHTKERV